MRISGTIFPTIDGEEFMGTELVAAVAYIATIIAVLVVALFPPAQLFMQRKQLEVAHEDLT